MQIAWGVSRSLLALLLLYYVFYELLLLFVPDKILNLLICEISGTEFDQQYQYVLCF